MKLLSQSNPGPYPLIDVPPSDFRTGVFICDCGENIAGCLNTTSLCQQARLRRPHVPSRPAQNLPPHGVSARTVNAPSQVRPRLTSAAGNRDCRTWSGRSRPAKNHQPPRRLRNAACATRRHSRRNRTLHCPPVLRLRSRRPLASPNSRRRRGPTTCVLLPRWGDRRSFQRRLQLRPFLPWPRLARPARRGSRPGP